MGALLNTGRCAFSSAVVFAGVATVTVVWLNNPGFGPFS
jgi:hypothetical protein